MLQLIFFLAAVIGSALVGKALKPGPASVAIATALYLILGVSGAWIVGRFVDRRPFSEFGFHLRPGWWLDFGFGLVLGAILMTGIFMAEYLAGWVAVTAPAVTESGLRPGTAILLSICFYLVVAFNEEFTCRGYQLRNLAEGLAGPRLGPRWAIGCAWAISSLAFGLGHITNDNSTALSTFNLVIGGLLLSLPYLLTGELAIPMGLHTTWNLFQGTVFGFPVSGSMPTRRVLIPEQGGPETWTGGAFGPEGGLLATIATLAGCLVVALWVWARQGRLGLNVSLASYQPLALNSTGSRKEDKKETLLLKDLSRID